MVCKYPGETETATALIKLLFTLLYAIEQYIGFTYLHYLKCIPFHSILHLAIVNDLHVL